MSETEQRLPPGADEWGFPRCRECDYAWGKPLDEVERIVASASAAYASLLAGRVDAKRRPDEKTWSPSGYVWHISDWLRIQGGRVYGIRHDPNYTSWPVEPDDIDALFHYDELSTVAGLWILERSAETFLAAIAGLDPELTFEHPVVGELVVMDLVRYVCHEVPHHEMDMKRGLGVA